MRLHNNAASGISAGKTETNDQARYCSSKVEKQWSEAGDSEHKGSDSTGDRVKA